MVNYNNNSLFNNSCSDSTISYNLPKMCESVLPSVGGGDQRSYPHEDDMHDFHQQTKNQYQTMESTGRKRY